jgi:hypothetical protein
VLDYTGNAQEMGKNLGDDLREGKCTLPLIAAMQRGSAEQAAIVRNAIEQGSTDQLDAVVEIVRSTGALDVARAAAHAKPSAPLMLWPRCQAMHTPQVCYNWPLSFWSAAPESPGAPRCSTNKACGV